MPNFSTCPCEFQPKVQVDCAFALVEIVRSGDLLGRRGEAMQHIGCIVGCLGSYMGSGLDEGRSTLSSAEGSSELPETVEACCAAIEAEQSRTESTELPEDKAFGVSPILIMLIARLAKLLLEQML